MTTQVPSVDSTPVSRRARRRWPLASGIILVVLLAGGAATLRYRTLSAPLQHLLHSVRTMIHPAAPVPAPAASVALQQVVQGPVSSQEEVSGTVQFVSAAGGADQPVINEAHGVLTAVPAIGQVISQGQALFGVDGRPVILLLGPVPSYRTLMPGSIGQDVQQLNTDLASLGYGAPAGSNAFGDATAAALKGLQAQDGLPATGELPLGQALFLPAAVRVAAVEPSLGASVAPGESILKTTSTSQEVVAQIDPSQAQELQAGQSAAITFANGSTVPGTIRSVAKVAASSGPGSAPTVEVDITPAKASALAGLDNASVQVAITTASVPQALAVPVTALLAQASGGYAVEAVAADGTHSLVPVRLGIFDDAAGLVQVTGPGLAAGQEVVVAGT